MEVNDIGLDRVKHLGKAWKSFRIIKAGRFFMNRVGEAHPEDIDAPSLVSLQMVRLGYVVSNGRKDMEIHATLLVQDTVHVLCQDCRSSKGPR